MTEQIKEAYFLHVVLAASIDMKIGDLTTDKSKQYLISPFWFRYHLQLSKQSHIKVKSETDRKQVVILNLWGST